MPRTALLLTLVPSEQALMKRIGFFWENVADVVLGLRRGFAGAVEERDDIASAVVSMLVAAVTAAVIPSGTPVESDSDPTVCKAGPLAG
jgi:hypothetical protein